MDGTWEEGWDYPHFTDMETEAPGHLVGSREAALHSLGALEAVTYEGGSH